MNIVIKEVKVQNFLSYGRNIEENVFNFENGLDIVLAQNGAGKSAFFLDSLCYGLYGKPYRKIKLSSLQNTINSKELKVHILLEVNKNTYKIIRGMNPSIFEIYKDEVLLKEESSVKSYQKMLEENILGTTEEVFRNLIVFGAGVSSSKSFLDLSSKEKEEIFNTLIDTKIFQELTDLSKKYINAHKTLNTEYEYKEKVLKEVLDSEKERINNIKSHNQKIQNQKEQQIKELNDLIQDVLERNEKINMALLKEDSIRDNLSKNQDKLSSKNTLEKEQKIKIHNLTEKLLLIKSAEKTSYQCKKCGTINYTVEIDEDLIQNKDKYKQELLDLKEELNLTENDINDLKDLILNLSAKIDKILLLKKEFEINTRNIENYQKQIQDIQNSEVLELNTSLYEKKQKEYQENKDVLLENKNKLEKYIWINSILGKDTLKGEVIKTQIPLLNKYINEFLEQFSVIAYNLVIGKDFKEQIISRSACVEFNQLSNGQKARLTFACMFGFLKLLETRNSSHWNILILDEAIDSSFDDNGRAELLDILKNEFSNEKDIIIISHNQEIKERSELFEREIYISKDKFSKISIKDI